MFSLFICNYIFYIFKFGKVLVKMRKLQFVVSFLAMKTNLLKVKKVKRLAETAPVCKSSLKSVHLCHGLQLSPYTYGQIHIFFVKTENSTVCSAKYSDI